jgi:hypothetical protein
MQARTLIHFLVEDLHLERPFHHSTDRWLRRFARFTSTTEKTVWEIRDADETMQSSSDFRLHLDISGRAVIEGPESDGIIADMRSRAIRHFRIFPTPNAALDYLYDRLLQQRAANDKPPETKESWIAVHAAPDEDEDNDEPEVPQIRKARHKKEQSAQP